MNLSAMTFALILTAFQQPAYGEELVVAAGDEYATENPVEGPQLPSMDEKANSAVASAPVESQDAEFQRLFGSIPSAKLPKADQKLVDKTSQLAWPWWTWPVGLLAIGVLFMIRSKVQNPKLPVEAIRVVSRQTIGKDGALALIEVHDGDSRKRRLLVGLGGGSPRLVADVSAWEVAVAAPSNIANDAVALMGPDPELESPQQLRAPTALKVAPQPFEGHLRKASQRYSEPSERVEESANKAVLIEEVLAQREQVRRESADVLGGTKGIRQAKRKPTYSSREVVV